jgi:hypothetical protein
MVDFSTPAYNFALTTSVFATSEAMARRAAPDVINDCDSPRRAPPLAFASRVHQMLTPVYLTNVTETTLRRVQTWPRAKRRAGRRD